MPPRKVTANDFLGDLSDDKPVAAKHETPAKVTVKMAEGLVGTVQLLLANLPWTKDDVLSDLEQKLLVKDVVAFAGVNPFFAKAVVWLFSNLGQAGLPIDLAAMGAKRLARRELIPAEIGAASEIAIIVSAAAHDIDLDEQQAQIASLFGGLVSGEEEEAPTTEPVTNGFATPDLVKLTD